MVTGGEDKKVNMWAVGKPNVILVYCKLYIRIKYLCFIRIFGRKFNWHCICKIFIRFFFIVLVYHLV